MSGEASHALMRWLFLRLLAVVFLIAFVSYGVQSDGLIGSRGILPASDFMRSAEGLGAHGFWQLPTLCWLGSSDEFLRALAGAGVLLSLLLLIGIAAGWVLFCLWAIYLSLVVVGQTFYSFQWDILLLEAAFTSLFLAPWTLMPRAPWTESRPPRAGVWLVRSLLFKLTFLSGITKLISLDSTWWALTSLDYHYYTQPLPVWVSWYAHHLPQGFQQLSVFVMFVIELGAPFLLFFPRRFRIAGALAMLWLQCLIAATGNYGFFNLLTAVLCVTWLDDASLARLVPRRWRGRLERNPREGGSPVPRIAHALVVAAVAYASSLTLVEEMVRTRPPGRIGGAAGTLLDWGAAYVAPGESLLDGIRPFRTISGYGLFRSMTTARPEIVIETSEDGRHWREVEFPYKPGDVTRRPRFVAPHQPRLDWQMWFAALSPRRAAPWLEGLIRRMLEGSEPVLGLLDAPELLAKPPRYVRLVSYEYWFTTPEEASAAGGAWWRRERRGELSGPISLDGLRR